jgi:hypothetical protein
MVKRIGNQLAPLCMMTDNTLVCYKHGNIVLLEDMIVTKKFPLFKTWKERILGRCKLAYRALRLGIRAAESIDSKNVVLSRGNMLYELNIQTGKLSDGYFCGEDVRPLIFSKVEAIKGFDDGIYFGGYLNHNGAMDKTVGIYHRVGVDKWETVYTFPEGTINHVHTIVSDHYRQCLWIFTGDFDKAAAIWKATEGFCKVERVACNDQKYRACIVYAIPEGLLYATDAPYADDYIHLLNTETMEAKELFPIHGSCIYGCQWKDKYVFSSTVEGDGRNMSRLEWLFTRIRGAGIKDDYVHMYMGNLKEGFKEIYKEKKDCMPYYTFQFGVFKFPAGVNNTDTLYFQPVATKKNDLRMMSINQEKI